MSVKVKICGITNREDAQAAVAAGADLLGFVFCEDSPRHVTVAEAAAIAQLVPPQVVRVGLFVNAPEELVAEAMSGCGLQLLQFHGDETPEYCRQFGAMSMKAFRMKDAETLQHLREYPTDAWLLDAFVPGQRGGTGHTFNWELAVAAVKLGKPVFLAGGLTPENVAEAVHQVQPFGVDVSSGVEAAPGKKDHAKVRAFVQAAKSAAGP
ncbi:MAG TPA: phosphoribosylanthranilate isomerase [Verrucomicrobiae bacterium]|nr:phosphoribosylanthranilate isomerase [Verrucomicrobiae bacterium]